MNIYISLVFPGIINNAGMLFRGLEEKTYRPVFSKPSDNCQSLVEFSNSILNRRKSRAGKSLEHHLADIFTQNSLLLKNRLSLRRKRNQISYSLVVNVITTWHFRETYSRY